MYATTTYLNKIYVAKYREAQNHFSLTRLCQCPHYRKCVIIVSVSV